MFYHAANKTIQVDHSEMDYITFGSGKRKVVMIPGLGDGMHTVKGAALPIAFLYREFSREYTVYMFSRKTKLEEGYTTRDMARDQKRAMDQLGIEKADIIGVSQGGMIAQYIAIDYPEMVNKLILVVTASRTNQMIEKAVGSWLEMAKEGKYMEIQLDTAKKMYSKSYLKKYEWIYPLLCKIRKPKDFTRFMIMADACLTHNAYSELYKIKAPCLIIGADKDRVVGGAASKEIAAAIPHSRIYMYPDYGHGVFEEAEDFNWRVKQFLE